MNFPKHEDGRLNHREAVKVWLNNKETATKVAFSQCGYFVLVKWVRENIDQCLEGLSETAIRERLGLKEDDTSSSISDKISRKWEFDDNFKRLNNLLKTLFETIAPPELKPIREQVEPQIKKILDHLGNKLKYIPDIQRDVINDLLNRYCNMNEDVWTEDGIGYGTIVDRHDLLDENIGIILEMNYNQANKIKEGNYNFNSEYQSDILQFAQKYVNEPLMQSYETTRFILCAVIDIIRAGNRIGNPPSRVNWLDIIVTAGIIIGAQQLGEVYDNRWIPIVTFVVLFAILINGRTPQTIMNKYGLRKDSIFSLPAIREEINIGSYNTERISQRVQAIENNGVWVPSIIYSLLTLKSQ